MSPASRNLSGLLALLCFLCLNVAPVSGDPGTPFTLSVKKSETEPVVGVNCYVFNGSGSYLGKVGATNSNGDVTFDLADGAHKFRVDYLGYQFWSEIYSVPTSQSGVLTIPHEEVVITVEGLNQGSPDPMQGLNVYLFTGSGSYMGQSRVTNTNGEVVFNLPDRSYKVRADYLGRQFWSEPFTWQDATVTIPMGDAEITVTGLGLPLAGVNVYVFSAAGAYLGVHATTDSNGKVGFTLPAGSYKYRADYRSSQFWSSEEPLVAGQTNPVAISTGGGSFSLTIQRGASDPLAGVNCYLFNEAGIYLGINRTTDSGGLVSFNVSNGTYKFRVDYLGYQFWTEIYSVPSSLSGTLAIPHQDVTVSVDGLNQGSPYPMEGIGVYLFTASGSYLGQSLLTNSSGEVTFNLPESSYKVRADYLGQQFWSEPFTWQDKTVTIPMGDSEVTVTGSGLPLTGVNVYVFSETGAYLGISGSTNSSGKVVFTLPAGAYKYRADYQASQYWSGAEPLIPGQTNPVTISTGGGTFTLTVQRGPADPLAGVNCYVLNGAGAYLGMSAASNTVGAVSFNLSNGAYKFRADYLGYQFWSDIYSVPTSLSGTLTIPHQGVVISVTGMNQASSPMAGVPVYLFTGSSAYMGQSLVTDTNGQVTFSLPEQAYKVRADYLGQQFWSDVFQWQNATVAIPMGDAEITVTGSGLPLAGVNVYVFSAAGAYLGVSGTTDGDGKAVFTLPAGTYKYRADYQGNQYWSGEEGLTAGQVNPVTIVTVPGTIQVPDVVGLSQADAGAAITAAGLVIGTTAHQHSATVPEGLVISQNPAAGTYVASGSPVDLVVSLGLAPMPTANITATPQTVHPGESVTLSWTSSNADSCAIEPGIGSVGLSGSLQMTPAATTTYIITATGLGGTATDSITVFVTSIPFGRDDDGDGLPDWWELAHFPDLSQGRNGDYDGDGFSNYLEYVFNTDPNNQNEVPPSSDYQDADYGYADDEQEGGAGLVAGSIRIVSGNAIESREDLAFPSPNSFGLSFRATYNSRLAQGGILGYGWSHTYGVTLNPAFQMGDRAFLKILDGTGKASYFVQEGSGNYNGVFGERTYVKAEGGGYVWYRVDGTRMSFNASGKLTSIRDEKGNSIDLTYNGQGNPATITDTASSRTLTFYYNNNLLDHITGPVTTAVPNGIWVTYGYDGNQNLTAVTYADGSGFSYVYNDANDIHNLTQKKDLLNHILREWAYNSSDQATAALTPDGRGVTLITYSDTQAQVRDVYNVSRTYTLAKLDGRKKVTALTGITNAPYTESNALRWVYDDRSRLTEVEYGGGTINRYQNYDERGNPGTVILAYGSADQRTIQYTYHPEMNVPLTRTESSALQGGQNKITIWDYDNDYDTAANEAPTRLLSRLVEQGYTVDMNGTVISYEYITTFTYNAKGQVLSVDGPRAGSGDTTTFAYNATTGNLESVTQPIIGSTQFTEYDTAGRPGRVTDVNGQAKGFTYDGRGRITAVTNYADSPASSTQFAYVGGLLDSMTDPDGVAQYFNYDSLHGRLSTITDQDGNYISHTYETYPRGNLTERSKYTSSHSRTSRDRWSYEQPTYPGKLYREIQADDTFREYDYDGAGNVIWAKDPKGYTTTYAYDFMNRLESVAQRVNDPNPRDLVTSYAYDTHGNLISVTDAKSNETIYDYDDMGRVVSTDSPDTGIQNTAYDQAGNLRYKTDAKGVRVEYTYDNLNRVSAAIYPDSVDDIAYSYDQGTNGKGHLTTMDDPSGIIGFGYDPRGRLVQKTSTISGINYPVTYAYTPSGKVGSVTYPSGRVITYDRNPLGKISEVTASGIANPLASGLTYRPFGGPLGLTNGFGGTVNNQAGECDCLTVSNPGQPRERTYGYDPNRNLTSITGTTTPWYSQTFGYDQLNRLTGAAGRYGSIAYTYDDAGNRLTRNTNGVNENYTYYTGTNSLYQVTGGSNPRAFAYDANGNVTGDGTLTFIYDQISQVKEVKQGQTSKATYTYNGLGQRVKKAAGGVTTIYHYDLDGKLIAESLPNGTMTKEYLYMGKIRVAMVDVAGGNALYHYLNDRLGTPEILTDANGTVAWEAWYEPFGEAHIHPSSSVVNNIRLPGQYYDAETGLHYNYHRYYDPRTGRYITADPIGHLKGENLYRYANCTPVNLTDPLGLFAIDEYGNNMGPDGPDTADRSGNNCEKFLRNAAIDLIWMTPILLGQPPLIAPTLRGPAGSNWARLSGMLRDAARGKGNFGVGSATRSEADVLGKAWVGRGHTVASDGKTLISADRFRQYRAPEYKPELGRYQANLEQRFPGQTQREWQSNAHLDIKE